jgi:pyruvate/oxaloacetate carboxyltransferase
VLLDPMHEVPAVIEAARLVKQEGEAEVMCALTFTLSNIHTDAFYADFARAVGQSADIDLFYIKDPSGLLSVDRARTLVPAVKAAIGNRPLEIHAHTTIGQGMLSSLEAAKLGVSAIHVGIGPGATDLRCRSQPDAGEPGGSGAHGAIDKAALARLTQYWTRLAAAEGLPGQPQNFDASFLRHQIAGGVMTTTARQLDELGLSDRLGAVIAETEQVRAELGYPIMVTPFPQMVMSQALFNVIGDRRYAQVSDQVVRYCLGKFGKPTSPIDPQVLAAIMDRPRARTGARAHLPALADLRRQFGVHLSDEEFLLRAVMPPEQVDAMQAAGRSRAGYTPGRADARPAAQARRATTGARYRDRTAGLSPRPPCGSRRMTLSKDLRPPARCRRLRVRHGWHDRAGRCQRRAQGPASCHRAARGAEGAGHALCRLHQRHGQAARRLCRLAAQGRLSGGGCADAPSSSTADWLRRSGVGKVRVLGNAGCRAPLDDAGLDVVGPDEAAEG